MPKKTAPEAEPSAPMIDEHAVAAIPDETLAELKLGEFVPAPASRVTVEELVALRRSVDAVIAADNAKAREAAAVVAFEWVDRELDEAGFALVHNVLVPHGSVFQERTGITYSSQDAINSAFASKQVSVGDRVWSKAAGWIGYVAPESK